MVTSEQHEEESQEAHIPQHQQQESMALAVERSSSVPPAAHPPTMLGSPSNGIMTEDEQKDRRASIKAIMADESLTPMERRRSIQSLMDGRRRSSGAAGSMTAAAGSMVAAAAAVAATYDDSEEDSAIGDDDEDVDDSGGPGSDRGAANIGEVEARLSSSGINLDIPRDVLIPADAATEELPTSAGGGGAAHTAPFRSRRRHSSGTARRRRVSGGSLGSPFSFGRPVERAAAPSSSDPATAPVAAPASSAAETPMSDVLMMAQAAAHFQLGIGMSAKKMEKSRPPCTHYDRKCTIIAPCCGLAFGCRICHDECPVLPPPIFLSSKKDQPDLMDDSAAPDASDPDQRMGEDDDNQTKRRVTRSSSLPTHFQDEETHHNIDRFAIKEIVCRECYTRQSSKTNNCTNCGVQFGEYHCSICNLWMSAEEEPYHCSDCGFCRVGGRDNFRHCHDCGMCIDSLLFEDHNCKTGKYMSNCPVCQEDLFSSRSASHEMPCGHAIHWHCFRELTSFDTRCPVCKKTAEPREQMAATWSAMAMGIALQPVPPDLTRVVTIVCNDCEQRDDNRRWHFLGVQCLKCTSFNTVIESTQLVGLEAAAFLGDALDPFPAGVSGGAGEFPGSDSPPTNAPQPTILAGRQGSEPSPMAVETTSPVNATTNVSRSNQRGSTSATRSLDEMEFRRGFGDLDGDEDDDAMDFN